MDYFVVCDLPGEEAGTGVQSMRSLSGQRLPRGDMEVGWGMRHLESLGLGYFICRLLLGLELEGRGRVEKKSYS